MSDMDPQAAWERLVDALRQGQRDEALECLYVLTTWIETDGFLPYPKDDACRDCAEEL